jgi:predicted dehydrogenase
MGQFHARHLARNPQVALVGVVDPSAAHSRLISKKFRVPAYPDPSQLIGHMDAAIIATPTPTHYTIGKQLLEAGIPCLIEKPLTATLPEAEELIAIAEQRGVILQVGHIERFNPAVIAAANYIVSPQFIEVNRLGPYDLRVAHIGVVMDLMIHDLDIVLFLVGQEITRVEAVGARVLSDHEDIAKVRLYFAGGCIADLSASRVSMERYRRIRVFQKNAYLSIDYAAPQLKIYRKKHPVVKSFSDVEFLKPKLAKQDPLALEQSHFLECVREGKKPLVSGYHGRDALRLAREVLQNLKIHD